MLQPTQRCKQNHRPHDKWANGAVSKKHRRRFVLGLRCVCAYAIYRISVFIILSLFSFANSGFYAQSRGCLATIRNLQVGLFKSAPISVETAFHRRNVFFFVTRVIWREKEARERARERKILFPEAREKKKRKRGERRSHADLNTGRNFRMKYEPWYFTRRDASPCWPFCV